MLNLRASNRLAIHGLPGKVRSFGGLLLVHLKLHWGVYLFVALSTWLFADNYRVGLNQTPSLPQAIFLIHKNEPALKGDYVAFMAPKAAGFKHESILTKIVVGEPGDVVTVSDRVVSVNGHPVGFAKTHSLKGDPLEPIEPVVIGQGQMYVMGLHKDSLDSRYRLVGLVPRSAIVGKAHPIW